MTTRYTQTTRDVAKELKFSEKKVRDMCSCGELPCIRIRGTWRIAENFHSWLATHNARPV